MSSVVVIGVGNPHRGDDGAGREVARRLSESGGLNARIVETDGEAATLLGCMDGVSTAFLIDACVSGAPVGSVRRINLAEESLPSARYGLSSHGFGLAAAIELALALGRLPPRCIVYAIEAGNFDHGAPLSTPVASGVAETVEALCREISRD